MMASINQLEKLHKELFNTLSFEEKRQYYKKLSEDKFKHFLFISEEGNVTLNENSYNNLDNLQVFLNYNKEPSKEIVNCGLAITSDYEALKDKYVNQYKVASKFYVEILISYWSSLKIYTIILNKLLATYEEKPTEEGLATIKDVNSLIKDNFKRIDSYLGSFIDNDSKLWKRKEVTDVKKELTEDLSSYVKLTKKIEKLNLPEGAVNNG